MRSGTWAIGSLTRIARFLRWKEFVVAFILMAFATSIPELFVGISAALGKIPQLSLGDIFGANIINLTLAVGIVTLILGGLSIERETVRRNSILMAVVALLPLLLLLDGQLSRIDGCILLLAFGFYLAWLFDRKELFTKVYNDFVVIWDIDTVKKFIKTVMLFFASVALLIIAAQGIIQSASFFAKFVGVSLGVIGIFLVGAGTALPEVYFSIKAGRSGQSPMILGNLMGSIVVNSTFILGLVALIHPIILTNFAPYSLARIFLLLSVMFFLFLSRTKDRISKKEAIILLLIYIVFAIFELIF